MAAFCISYPVQSPLSSLQLTSKFYPSQFFSVSFPNRSLLFTTATLRNRSTLSYRRQRPRFIVAALNKLSETELVTLSDGGVLPSDSGVYAVYDSTGDLLFVGITRNLAASVATHRKSIPELCFSVKVAVVENPDKTSLTEAWKSWLQEHIEATGIVPPGNQPGNSVWVKKAPQKKSDLRLTPGRHVELNIPLEELIDKLVKQSKVVAFIKGSRNAPLCGFSQRVVAILESQGIEYESVDVLDEEYNFGLRETLKSYSNWPTFPQIFVKGELVGGCDILTSMYEKGQLSDLLK